MEEELFDIPGYSLYRITKGGAVFSLISGRFLVGSVNNSGYLSFRLINDDGKTRTEGVHRLMGYAFLPCPGDFKDFEVNHINGIKEDVSISNLEWTTRLENHHHAGRLGLTSKCIPIETRDIDTLEVKRYPSIISCARDLGMTKDAVAWRVEIGPSRIFPERKQYRKLDQEWVDVDSPELKIFDNTTCKQVLALSHITGEEIVFDKLTDLAKHIGVALSTVSQWLSKYDQPVVPGFLQIKKRSDPRPWNLKRDPFKFIEVVTGTRVVEVIDDKSGKKYLFHSAASCAKAMGLKPTALNHRLKSNGSVVYSDGKRYKYRNLRCVP